MQLWPYVPGVYGRDALYRLWRLLEDEGLIHRAFWDRALFPETCGDLASFIKTFDGAPTTQLAFVVREPAKLLGCIWLSEIVPRHQAFISICLTKEGRPFARIAGSQALDYIFETWDFYQVWSITPWHGALALATRLGFRRYATLPAYCRFPTQVYDAHLLRLTKEDWYGQSSDSSRH